MAKRTFPQQTVAATNTIQPAFSTTFNGSVSAGSGDTSVVVTSSAGFVQGDYVSLSIGTARQEYAYVLSIPDSTHLKVHNLVGMNFGAGIGAHTSGDFIALFQPCRTTYIQRVSGDTNILYVGDSTLNPGASPPVGIIASLAGFASGQPEEFSDAFVNKLLDIGNYWVYGTINTVYNISATLNN